MNKLVNNIQKSNYNTNYKVYFISTDNFEFIKVGISNNPYKRLKGLQQNIPNKLILLMTFNGKNYEETLLHHFLKKYKVRGEWFELNNKIITLMKKINEEVKSSNVHYDLNKVYEYTNNKINLITKSDYKNRISELELIIEEYEHDDGFTLDDLSRFNQTINDLYIHLNFLMRKNRELEQKLHNYKSFYGEPLNEVRDKLMKKILASH